MFLLINLSAKDAIHLSLFNEQELVEKKFSGQNRELLGSVDSFFKAQKFKKEDLEGVMAVVGAGGFTSTRIAAVVANSFGYVLQIPLLAITEDKVERVQELIPKLKDQKPGVYISATYSGEPNITKSNLPISYQSTNSSIRRLVMD